MFFIWFVVGIALQDSMKKQTSVLSLLYHHTIKVTYDRKNKQTKHVTHKSAATDSYLTVCFI